MPGLGAPGCDDAEDADDLERGTQRKRDGNRKADEQQRGLPAPAPRRPADEQGKEQQQAERVEWLRAGESRPDEWNGQQEAARGIAVQGGRVELRSGVTGVLGIAL